MTRVLRCLALAVVAAYLAAVTTPCPPPGYATAAASEARSAHAAHADHAAHAGGDHPAHHAGAHASDAAAPSCHAPDFVFTAACPCGCGTRPEAAGVATGVGWAVISRTAAPPAPANDALAWPRSERGLPAAPGSGIDHVPLAI